MIIENLEQILKTVKHVHFTGIGGVSMSALAEILSNRGYKVTGSDIHDSETVRTLRQDGILVSIGHDEQNIDGAELLIHTAAVKEDNPEIARAKQEKIPVFERATLLGVLMKSYSYPIAVAGTHGKTTTTSMISQMLLSSDLDPTCLVGGQLSSICGNKRIGASEYMVCEACEYVDSFLSLLPKISVILNIDLDHLDYFRDLDRLKSSFHSFALQTNEDGHIVYCGDDANTVDTLYCVERPHLTYGLSPGNNVRAANLSFDDQGCGKFDVLLFDAPFCSLHLAVPGEHNVLNALAAAAVGYLLELSPEQIQKGIESFTGTKRRFEKIGEVNGATVIDDYAHHPSEIKATLLSARRVTKGKIFCIFQPHTYSRTVMLMEEFCRSLALADEVILCDIYSAREKNTYGVSSEDLARKLPGSFYAGDFLQAADYVRSRAQPGDLVCSMGAGDIYKVALLLCGKE